MTSSLLLNWWKNLGSTLWHFKKCYISKETDKSEVDAILEEDVIDATFEKDAIDDDDDTDTGDIHPMHKWKTGILKSCLKIIIMC